MRKLKVAAFIAHPDDMESLFGGTLLKYVDQGNEVHLVVATDGRRGRANVAEDVSWQEIVKIRRLEQIDSVAGTGIQVHFLDIEDHRLLETPVNYEKVITVMESLNPDVVITLSPNDYHNDHRCISRLALNAAWAPVFFCEVAGGVDFVPDFYVDVTDYIDKKIAMLKKHKSQLPFDPEERVRTVSRFRGIQCGKKEIKYAEAFKLFKRFDWVKGYELLPKDEFELPERIVPTMKRN